MGTTLKDPLWKVDLFRFRVYLKEKYMVDKAFIILDMYKMVLSINSSMKKFRLQVLFGVS